MPGLVTPPPSTALRVLVADDQDIVRDGLATVLGLLDGVEVVGTARDGDEAVELVARLRPQVVLMDLRMPRLDGVAATAAIVTEHPGVAVVVLTTYDDDASIARALRAGARGYLTKDASRDDIAAALHAVVRGQTTVTATVGARLIDALGSAATQPATASASTSPPLPVPTPAALAGLTAREREVLGLIGVGLTNGEIADRLFVSTSTVKTHINNLFAKLHLRDRPDAVRRAIELFGR